MQNRQNYLYVGVDLHKEHHTAVIINCWQEKLEKYNLRINHLHFRSFTRSRDICV